MIKLYIANLGKYVEGELVGDWITLPITQDDFSDFLKTIQIDGERYEEIAIHDYMTDLGISIGEYESISKLNELAEATDGNEKEFSAIYEAIGDIDDSLRVLENHDYCLFADIDNEEDLGYEWVAEGLFGVNIPDSLSDFINYEAIGRSLDFTFTNNGAIYVY